MPFTQVGIQSFIKIVAAKSSGKITIGELGTSVLGSDGLQISVLQGGE